MFKHWKTTLLGAITGIVMIVKGILGKNPIEVIEGVGIALTGALASDSTITDKEHIDNKEMILDNNHLIDSKQDKK